jgi:catechol 2,3-dioxygenase-like lactoylglutathione lyase family enzyme
MQAKDILETCLYVDDLEAAEAFYIRVLGLEVHSRGEGRHVFFRCGRRMFLVFNPSRTQRPEGEVPTHGAIGEGHVAFVMEKDEIPAWREHLRKHSVEIEVEITWPGGGYSIYFRDPAGNSVELATPGIWRRFADAC